MGVLRERACEYAGADAQAVKATLFDKTAAANWKVPWHQDLTIAVRRRLETTGFGPWSMKDGVPHVQPPVSVLEALVALRLHLDDTPEENGALRVVVASHRLGRIPEAQIAAVRANGRERVATVPAGGVMVMSPLLLHASSASSRPEHRRVLHVEYSSFALPAGLKWAEAAPKLPPPGKKFVSGLLRLVVESPDLKEPRERGSPRKRFHPIREA